MKTQSEYKKYWLSTEGYSFHYRPDRYNPQMMTHVEMFKDGNVVHKICSKGYGKEMTHHEVINALEVAIQLNQLDPTGLKQLV